VKWLNDMTVGTAITTFSIPEPVEAALRLVRVMLVDAGLRVLGGLDISGSIQRSLGIHMAQCKVLHVCSNQSTLEAVNGCPAVGIFLPLHIVFSARGEQTDIHLLASLPPSSDNPLAAPVNRLQDEISRAIEKIAMRHSYCRLVP